MREECLNAIYEATGKQMTSEEGDNLIANIRLHMGALRRQDPEAWSRMTKDDRVRAGAAAYAEQIRSDAKRKKANMMKLILRQDERIREMDQLIKEKDLHAYSALAKIMQGVYRRARGIQNEYASELLDTLKGIRSEWVGFVENKEDVLGFVREAYGQDSGNERSKAAWEAWKKTTDAIRERAYQAGAEIGKIDYGYIPQSHDLWRIRKAGKARWVNEIFPLMDRERFTDAKGDRMGDAELRKLLEGAYDDIITNGVVTDDVTEIAKNLPTFRRERYKKYPSRVLHFKDAESFIRYEGKYGQGSLTGSLMGHIAKMSNDISLLESFGPKPRATYNYLKSIADNEAASVQGSKGKIDLLTKYSDYHGLTGATVDEIWNVLSGVSSQIEINRDGVANFMSGWRNLEVVGKLGKAFISSFSDIPMYFVASKFNRLGFSDSLRFFKAAFGGEWKEYANRAGFISDSIISDFNRWASDNIGQGFTAKLANATMRASFLNWYTDSVRRAMCLNMMAGLAKLIKRDWDDLDAYDRARLEEGGINRRDFEVLQMAGTETYKGIEFVTLRQLRALDTDAYGNTLGGLTKDEIDAMPGKVLGFVINESEMASLGPDLITRAETTRGFKRGTINGELARSLFLFKSFPIAMMERHFRRLQFLNKYGEKSDMLSYGAAVVVGTTLFGAFSLQVQNLLNGKDLQDMESTKFWSNAFAKGGGLGFLGDWIVNGISEDARYGAMTGLTNFAGPVVGTAVEVSDLVTATMGSAIYDKGTKPGARAVRIARSHMPFLNLWYASCVFDHAVMNDVMDYLSPGYLQKRETKLRRGTGQGYWWGQEDGLPSRAPRWAEEPD